MQEDSRTAGQLHENNVKVVSSTMVTIFDRKASLIVSKRTNDGTNESIVFLKFTQKAVLIGIVKTTRIDSVTLQVALKDDSMARKASFS